MTHVAAQRTFRISPLKIVGTELLVRHAIAHDVVRDFENLVTDGDDGLFMIALSLDATIARL